MNTARRWILGLAATLAALLLVLCAIGLYVAHQLPDDAELAAYLSRRFEQASGVPLRIGAAHWALRPIPVVELSEVATVQDKPITVRRIVVKPRLAPLWQRRVEIDAVEVDGVVLARESVAAFRGRWKDNDMASLVMAGAWQLADTPVASVRARDVTWIDRRGIALAYDAAIEFDPGWRPRTAEASRAGVTPPARLRLDREGEQDRWRVRIDVGGGTWNGNALFDARTPAHSRLSADLEARDIDLASMVQSFDRHNAIEGKLNGKTRIEAEGANATELVRSLHTHTEFLVKPAVFVGFDLRKAVTTAGKERTGRTPFDQLSGALDTQATDDGVMLRYTGLKARTGQLTASGSATVINRRIDGEAAIDVVEGVVGIPLQVHGTLDALRFTVTGSTAAGAALGTAVLPGVGTAIGARVGQQVEKMFGDDKAKATPKR